MILGKTNLDAQKAAENAANKVLLKEHTKTVEQLLEKINNLPLNDFEETHAYTMKLQFVKQTNLFF